MFFAASRIYTTVCGLGILLAACAPSSLVDVPPPNSVADPSVVTTATGAKQLYSFAVTRLAIVMAGGNLAYNSNYVMGSGMFTDELMRVQGAGFGFPGTEGEDERISLSIWTSQLYLNLNTARVESRQAREALRLYAPSASPAWQARMLAIEAYATVYSAEQFCSGIPLSTMPLANGSPTLTRGFATAELFQQAVVLFDSAVTMAGDSARFRYLAEVGKGRALLGLGRFADAAAVVADVPTNFVYLLEVGTTVGGNMNPIGNRPQNVQVVDNEGGNGLVWSTDPRSTIVRTPSISGAMLVPAKYSVTASGTLDPTAVAPNTPVRGADGLEARLIEAEAALALADPSWLTKLNMLRSTCVGTAACAPVPGLAATALPPLSDPGSADARLNLVMSERAMWLYLTGHRQGDLRRMAHVYNHDPATLWPTGTYLNPGFPPLIQPTSTNGTVAYGAVYVLDPSTFEPQTVNPLYKGCIDLNP